MQDVGSVRSVGTLRELQRHVVEMLERAESARDAQEACACLTFCVAGGGFAGIEMGAALARCLAECRTAYPVLARMYPRIVVVHAGDAVLPQIRRSFGSLSRYAREQRGACGIELRLETRIARIAPGRVLFEDGSALGAGSVITAAPSVEAREPDVARGVVAVRCARRLTRALSRSLRMRWAPRVPRAAGRGAGRPAARPVR